MTAESAYRLRRMPGADSFAAAWASAHAHAVQILADCAFERAIAGVAQPVFYKGEIVGERRVYSDSLLMFQMRYKDPMRYGVFYQTHAQECRRHPRPQRRAHGSISGRNQRRRRQRYRALNAAGAQPKKA
jgi:hypothetical protein